MPSFEVSTESQENSLERKFINFKEVAETEADLDAVHPVAALGRTLEPSWEHGKECERKGKGKSKNMDQVLASATKWIGLAWVLLTLALSII